MDDGDVERLQVELARLRHEHAQLSAHYETRARTAETRHRHLLEASRTAKTLAELKHEIEQIVSRFGDPIERERVEESHLQSQKLESLGRLAGGIAHDFNNLLTIISNYTSLALPGVTPEVRADLEHSLAAADRAARLTSQLLAFARKQVISPLTTNLNVVLTGVAGMLRRLIGEDIELVAVTDPDLWNVRVDPGQFEQVLVNLAANARDAMPQGGKLTLETANVRLDGDTLVGHSDVVAGDYVLLAVSDIGMGMIDSVREHAFEPFFTTKDVGRGTGLGLATVHGIVKQNGGYIWLYSEPERGTTFKIYLPRTDLPEIEVSRTEETTPSSGGETILVVEDDPLVRRLAARVLESQGYTVLQAENGFLALDVVRAHAGEIQLLLSDVVMPRMSGKALAKRLLEARPTLKVLYVSGYTDNTIVHHGVLDQGVAFLQKPYTPNALARKVRAVLDS